jgi:hypothetical protein
MDEVVRRTLLEESAHGDRAIEAERHFRPDSMSAFISTPRIVRRPAMKRFIASAAEAGAASSGRFASSAGTFRHGYRLSPVWWGGERPVEIERIY